MSEGSQHITEILNGIFQPGGEEFNRIRRDTPKRYGKRAPKQTLRIPASAKDRVWRKQANLKFTGIKQELTVQACFFWNLQDADSIFRAYRPYRCFGEMTVHQNVHGGRGDS